MNPNKVFFSQRILDGLITEGKIKLDRLSDTELLAKFLLDNLI